MIKSGWKNVPKCTKGKKHNWKKGVDVFGESFICSKCGYDVCEERYREIPNGVKRNGIPPKPKGLGILLTII